MADTKYFLVTGARGFFDDPRYDDFMRSMPAGTVEVVKCRTAYYGNIETVVRMDDPLKLPRMDIAILKAPSMEGADMNCFMARDACIEPMPDQLRGVAYNDDEENKPLENVPGGCLMGPLETVLEMYKLMKGRADLTGLEVPDSTGSYEYLIDLSFKPRK